MYPPHPVPPNSGLSIDISNNPNFVPNPFLTNNVPLAVNCPCQGIDSSKLTHQTVAATALPQQLPLLSALTNQAQQLFSLDKLPKGAMIGFLPVVFYPGCNGTTSSLIGGLQDLQNLNGFQPLIPVTGSSAPKHGPCNCQCSCDHENRIHRQPVKRSESAEVSSTDFLIDAGTDDDNSSLDRPSRSAESDVVDKSKKESE